MNFSNKQQKKIQNTTKHAYSALFYVSNCVMCISVISCSINTITKSMNKQKYPKLRWIIIWMKYISMIHLYLR